ncbi:transposase [Lentibacillus kimchii]|uniref:Transposase n=1 Tax=Lentibacillus kimchii TaxID=1542911 RepID=A0ABW2UUH7_9BACI
MPDAFYHIVCRGNRRDNLFLDDEDIKVFFQIMIQVNKKTPFVLASYCLMTNHFHLQLRSGQHTVSKVMSLINKRYADYYNTKYKLTGHVFEKRYYDKLIDSKLGMLETSRYIHLNPVEAGMVAMPAHYPWSSYRYYLYTTGHRLLNVDEVLDCFAGDPAEKRRKYQDFMDLTKKEVLIREETM